MSPATHALGCAVYDLIGRTMRRLARLFAFLTNALFAALVVGAALPGPHRILAPTAYSLTEIAPQVWTDAPGRSAELLGLTETARARVTAFFGDTPPRATLVLCSTRACADAFGIGGNGLSVADNLILVSPGGLTRGTLTHEMTHSRLHRSMGPRNVIRQPYPTWFDEGLATHVADHPKWNGTVAPTHRARVREVRRFWQLGHAFQELGVGRTYRAAAAEVAAIEARAGRAGLLELIARAEQVERFADVLAEVTAR
ncbi:MAG: hypothetical protein AAFV31_19035 [Pseudomonadota bacterium]